MPPRPALRLLLATLALALPACAPADGRTRELGGGYRGVAAPAPLDKPDFVLADTEGRPFDFRRETDGRLTLLFFGYTHCPDVCPVHLANIAAGLRELSWDDRQRVAVVFVTTDPERDTPARIREWLDAFDPAFVGLRGPIDSVNAIQARLGLAAAAPVAAGTPGAGTATDGGYTVGHAGQVIAFTADDRAHLFYPFGTRQRDWAADLPKLVHERWRMER